ncbi:carbohydrate sulfotransferase 11-like isoform X2 [Amblyomma americanum]
MVLLSKLIIQGLFELLSSRPLSFMRQSLRWLLERAKRGQKRRLRKEARSARISSNTQNWARNTAAAVFADMSWACWGRSLFRRTRVPAMAKASTKALGLSLVVAAGVFPYIGILTHSRFYPQLSPCNCSASSDRFTHSVAARPENIVDDLASRLARMDSGCKKYGGTLRSRHTGGSQGVTQEPKCSWTTCALYVVMSHHFAFCSVPKAATSSLKALVLKADKTLSSSDTADDIFSVFRRKHRAVLPGAYWRDKLGSSFTKVIIVRHPFERLVSAYLNKVRTTRPYVWGAKRMYKRGFVGSGPNGTFTFAEFVENILKEPVTSWDPHWAPYTPRCQPCTMRYDIIGKVETIDADLQHLLPKIGLAGWSFPRKNAKSRTHEHESKESSMRYFAELSRQQVLQLYAIYMYDFELFGYTLKGFASPVVWS